MKKIFILFIIFIITTSLYAEISVKDDTGNILKLKTFPERIIVLSPEINELIFNLGAEKKIIANSEYCDYPAESKKILKVGAFNNPDIEKIISLKPDLIFLTKGVQKDILIKLKNLDYKYFVLYISSIKKLYEAIRKISIIVNTPVKGRKLIYSIKSKLKKTKKIQKKYSVLPVIWTNPVMVAGSDTIVNDVINRAGGKNIAADYKNGYFNVSEEFLISNIPDYILLCGKNLNINSNKIFRLLQKKNKKLKIITINPDWLLRATPRITGAVLQLNRILKDTI